MRKFVFFVLTSLSIISSGLCVQAEPFHKQMAQVMSNLCAKVPVASDEKIKVYVQSPKHLLIGTSQEPSLLTGGGFIDYFKATCEAALKPPFVEIARDELDQIWSEVKIAQMTESNDPDKVVQWVKELKDKVSLPLDGIIISSCSVLNKDVDWNAGQMTILVTLYFIDVRNAIKHTEIGELYLTSKQASSATERPANYESIREEREQIENVMRDRVKQENLPDVTMFDLFVNVDKGAGGVYEDGELMTVYVSAEIDCYVAVININAKGEYTMLFPNRYEQENFIRAGQARQIPGPEPRNYDLAIYGPFGMETIKVVASTAPLELDSLIKNSKLPFPSFNKGLLEDLPPVKGTSKDVGPVAKEKRFAEAMCIFTTMRSGSKGLWME